MTSFLNTFLFLFVIFSQYLYKILFELKEKFKAILKLIRPINAVVTFVSVIVAAIICASGEILWIPVLLASFAAVFTLAAGNLINDIFDIEIDKVNRPDRQIPSGKITYKEAFLKRIPLAGNVVVAFLTGLVFIYGGVAIGNPVAAVIPALFAFLINLIREVVKDMQDVEGDKKSGIKTFPIKFGFQKSKVLILLLTISLILYTLYPFLFRIYKIEYFIVVMLIVNPLLVYCLKILFSVHSEESLIKISNLLKLNMIFGLIAIVLG
ncbi:MAG: geranylgeranylglycerol-phosphate geranylgeranyltransferase [Ignavibacteriaceae bacterium]